MSFLIPLPLSYHPLSSISSLPDLGGNLSPAGLLAVDRVLLLDPLDAELDQFGGVFEVELLLQVSSV